MHILFLDSSGAFGAPAGVLLNLLAAVRRARPHWALTLCAPADGPLVRSARVLGVQVILLPFPAGLSTAGDLGFGLGTVAVVPEALAYAIKLRAVLRSVDPDVIHSNSLRMHIAAAWTKPARVSLVWHLDDYVSRRSRSAAVLLRQSASACSAMVSISQSVADDARRLVGASVLSRAIHTGVDLTVFTPTGPVAALDSLATLPPSGTGTVRIGLVADYVKGKGQLTFLEALGLLPPSLPIRGYIVGGPICDTTESRRTRRELEAAAARLGLANRVGFIGFQHHAAHVYRALDVVVHASTEPEPFGLGVAEAMACGRAVIAAGAGGVPEIIDAGVDGLLHEPGCARDLAGAIERLAADAPLRNRIGSVARGAAERRMGSVSLVREFCRLYEAIAPRRARGLMAPAHA